MDVDNLERVSLPVQYTIDPNFSSDRFLKMRLAICHTGKNLNNTSFTIKEFQDAAPSLPYSPILACVEFDENGEPQFQGHACHEESTETGTRTIFDETPIGVIPKDCNYSIEQIRGKDFVCADAYIWLKYANYSLDIINRDTVIPLSMEINIKDYTYQKASDVYTILDFDYLGITFCDDPARVAMQGACAVPVERYSAESTRFFTKLKEELCEELANIQKGGTSLSTNTTSVPEQLNENEQPEAGKPAVADTPEEPEATEGEDTTVEPTEEGTTEETEETTEETSESSEESGEEATGSYGLMSNLRKSASEALSALGVKYDWGDGFITDRYELEDIDEKAQKIYVFDYSDYLIYAVNYNVDGDKVVLGDKFTRQVREYRDYTEGEVAPSAAFETINKMRSEYSAQIKSLRSELKEYQAYKEAAESEKKTAEVNALFEQFTDLAGVEEYEALKVDTRNDVKACEIASLETQLYAIRGKQVKVNYQTGQSKGGRVAVPKTYQNQVPRSGSRAVLEHFIPKKG